MVRPRHLEATREFLVREWNATVTDGYEADDAIGMSHVSDTVVCSIDKDMLQLAGDHYNFVTQTFFTVDTLEGWYNFYRQLLTGDRADNIIGVSGIGKVRSERILRGCTTKDQLHETVRIIYKDDGRFRLNGSLIYIWRKENDLHGWLPTSQVATFEPRPEEVAKLESILMKREETIQSTEHGGTKEKVDGFPERGR